MTLTLNPATRAWLNANMPNIRVAIPALRCRGSVSPAIKTPKAARQALEKQFRDDFQHLSRTKPGPKAAPKAGPLRPFSAGNVSNTVRQAA